MVFRTKTSKKTMEIYEYIYQREHLQPFALAKISIALAIYSNYKFPHCIIDIEKVKNNVTELANLLRNKKEELRNLKKEIGTLEKSLYKAYNNSRNKY